MTCYKDFTINQKIYLKTTIFDLYNDFYKHKHFAPFFIRYMESVVCNSDYFLEFKIKNP